MEPTRTQELAQAQENASDQVAIGFSFTSEWLRRQSKCFKTIIAHSKPKPKQFQITFPDIKLKDKPRKASETSCSML